MTERGDFRTERDLFILLIRKPSLWRDGQFSLVEGTSELKSNRSGLGSGAHIAASDSLCDQKQLTYLEDQFSHS